MRLIIFLLMLLPFLSDAQVFTLRQGGTSKALTASDGGIVYTDSNSMEVLSATATAGQVIRSGASTAPAWSTATYPNTATSGTIMRASGSNVWAGSTATYPNTGGTSGTIMRSDGTNWVNSTATYPNTTTSTRVLYSTGANTIGDDADLTFDGTTLTVTGGVVAGATGNFQKGTDRTVGSSAGGQKAITLDQTSGARGNAISLNENAATGPVLSFGKSRSGSVGGVTIVQSGDAIGKLEFVGADGVDMDSIGATIQAQVDGTPGSNDMPGRLMFSTTLDGGVAATEALRIDSVQHTLHKGTTPTMGTCGTSPSVAGVDQAALVTVGTGGIDTACIVNFGRTWTTAPVCVAQSDTDIVGLKMVTTTTTATISATLAFTASSKLHLLCHGY